MKETTNLRDHGLWRVCPRHPHQGSVLWCVVLEYTQQWPRHIHLQVCVWKKGRKLVGKEAR